MMARIRKSMEEKDQGFTLIELLVVMIIIGILAAIAVPVFLSQRTKARETSAKADVSSIGKDIAAYYVDGTSALNVTSSAGAYNIYEGAATNTGTPLTAGRLSNGNKVVALKVDSATAYCVAIQSGYATDLSGSSTDNAWKVTQAGLVKGATCP